jgi:site-specific recombinase XerD
MHHQTLLDKYSDTVAPASRLDLTAKMAKYLTWLASRTPTLEEAQRWIEKMRKAGYADNTLKKEYETIRQLYKVNGIPWDARRGDTPTVDEEKVWSPSLDPEAIKAMIQFALKPPGKQRWSPDIRDTCFLFLSTIWGPRRGEMAAMSPQDINKQSSLIHIETLKGGRPRWHWVPPDVMHFVTDWGFTHPTSLTAASQIFKRWQLAIGIETTQELGWHSIRHALARSLTDAGIPEERREQFMRWALKKSKGMGRMYGTAPVVGFSGVRRELVVDEQKNDEKILDVHLFLKYWRGEDE